jgi:hypothetical protein
MTDLHAIPVIDVAHELLGQENPERSTKTERHFPNHAGLFVNIEKNKWFSHGNAAGGDALDLVRFINQCDFKGGTDWLRSHGHIEQRRAVNGHRQLVAIHEYTDETGAVLFCKLRFDPKEPNGFEQRRPDGNGGWIYDLNGVRRVPYHLMEVNETIANGQPTFLVEGEKAADRLRARGVTATCTTDKPKQWGRLYADFFNGGDVIVLPDHDKPGEKQCALQANALVGHAKRVRVLRLPGLAETEDPYDWIEHGGTAEALWALVESDAVEWKAKEEKPTGWQAYVFTAASLRTTAFSDIQYIVHGIIPEGLSILAGRPKIGKSWMVLDTAIGVATGQNVLGGIKAVEGDVLYCALEDNKRRLQRRMNKLLSPFSGEWPERLTLATRWRRLDQGGVEDIEDWCDSVPEPRLIALDTLAGVRPARNGTDTLYDGDYKALQDIHHLASERGVGVVALHHTRKMEADDPIDTISGSLGLAGAADTCLILARGSAGTTLYVRGRDVEESERAIVFGSGNCRWTLLGDAAEEHLSETRKVILGALHAATDLLGPGAIAAITNIDVNNVGVVLHRMVAAGDAVQVSRGRYAHPSKEFATPCKNRKDVRKRG